jgi:proline dehydrogenase
VKALTFLAKRFVAGETAADAVRAGERLQARGIRATFDLLGEDVADREAARRSTVAIQELLRLIPRSVERNVSIKLSMTGLGLDQALCIEQATAILATAREVGGFVRLDMEGTRHTQATLDVFRKLREHHGPDEIGIVLQAYLHRTEADVRECIRNGDRVRLCKGAYKESAEVALQKMDDIRANYKKLARLLLDNGHFPALATHDEGLIRDLLGYIQEQHIPAERYEFQMLYGLRPKRWTELVAAGHGMRVYVPYGTHWLPYFYRRLRERKENIFFVVKGLFE